jgi:hypothetical protein
MPFVMIEVARDLAGTIEQPLAPPGNRSRALRGLRMIAERDLYDLGSIVLLGILVILILTTFRGYAITNDEWIQHRYGELIVAYYRSGFTDRSLFGLYNLYLYGGLFDSVAVLLGQVVPLDVFDLRHLMSAAIGVGGLGAALATARLIAGPRAGFLAGVALAVCGSWYGTMFHHTKDIPLAAAMAGAIYFLVRTTRDLPRPRLRHVVGFGVLTGAALGIKVLALLLVCYVPVAIALNSPAHCVRAPRDAISFMAASLLRFVPAFLIAYAIMIVAWPWSALAPLNPIRGLISFGDFGYDIPTVLDGHIYRMATVPRWYVPAYLLIKIPLLMLAGTALALMFEAVSAFARDAASDCRRRDVALIAFAAFFPLLCEAIAHGPAFCGLRHFLFVLPPMAVLTGVGLDAAIARAAAWYRPVAAALLAVIAAGFSWNALTLYRLHPYEYVVYNPLVGGLAGASRLYATDYWATIMPEAVDGLEAYLARTEPVTSRDAHHVYTVAFCGERAAFLKKARPHLHWAKIWETADFFIAPTHMNCDLNSRGRVVATVKRLGVPLGYVKDQRAMIALRHKG